jgi:hypothetical protein
VKRVAEPMQGTAQRDRNAAEAACDAARECRARRFRTDVARAGFEDRLRRDRRQFQANLAQPLGDGPAFGEWLPFLSPNRAWIEQRRYGHGGLWIESQYPAAGHKDQAAPSRQIGGLVGQERGNQLGVGEYV